MVIFYSYVSVPEGTNCETFSYAQPRQLKHKPKSFILESFCKGSLKSQSQIPGAKPHFEGMFGQQKPNPMIQAQKLQFSKVL